MHLGMRVTHMHRGAIDQVKGRKRDLYMEHLEEVLEQRSRHIRQLAETMTTSLSAGVRGELGEDGLRVCRICGCRQVSEWD